MSRNVFLSFLGNSNYKATRYYVPGLITNDTVSLRFIQEASIKYYCSDYKANDEIYILTTQTALKNWNDGKHKTPNGEFEWHEGLESRLNKLRLNCKISNIVIPEGQSKEDIWNMFETIFNLFKDDDNVIFDITHGFRPYPMLNLVLINYAKLLKNIDVAGIYYGAYEARETIEGEELTPIWDLSDFSKLQDWTNNASLFLNTGNATNLVSQITAKVYEPLKNNLKSYSELTLVNRGKEIYDGEIMVNLKEILSKDLEPEDPSYRALKPILKKIKSQFEPYERRSALNGFLAVKWCIENGLIQQAFTLLEESITTFIMAELGLIEEINDKDKRGTISAALTVGNNDFKYEEEKDLEGLNSNHNQFCRWQHNFVPKVQALAYRKEFKDLTNKIKHSARNDINHAGFREDSRNFMDFQISATKRYKELGKLLKKMKSIELPSLNN